MPKSAGRPRPQAFTIPPTNVDSLEDAVRAVLVAGAAVLAASQLHTPIYVTPRAEIERLRGALQALAEHVEVSD